MKIAKTNRKNFRTFMRHQYYPQRRRRRSLRKPIIGGIIVATLIFSGVFFYFSAKNNPERTALKALTAFRTVVELLPVSADTKKELAVSEQIVTAMSAQDGVMRTYMILLQNNHELRPGGGFLGQYAVIKIKDAQVESLFIEDANLADQRITAKVSPPYGLKRALNLKRWKLRDSNFSPDFPTNVEKVSYFYRLSGRSSDFDGMIAVNADTFNEVFTLTGPITVPGYGEFNSENATLKLEEAVERPFLGDDVPAELKQNRKNIMKQMGQTMTDRLVSLNNIPKIAELTLAELRNKNIMIWFEDPSLQAAVKSVHWDGAVATDWTNDYLFVVDANTGALKSDYYIKRRYEYTVDFTGGTDINTQDKNYREAQRAAPAEGAGSRPRATLRVFYDHTAPRGDWRTSDYHTWTRIYTPAGAELFAWLYSGSPLASEDFNKTVFGYKVDALIGRELETTVVYDLPSSITPENYELLVQKQSGVGTVPLHVKLITADGVFEQKMDLQKDVKLSLTEKEEEFAVTEEE